MKNQLMGRLLSNSTAYDVQELKRFAEENANLSDEEFSEKVYDRYHVADSVQTNAAIRQMCHDVGTIKGIAIAFLVIMIVGIVGAFIFIADL